MAKSEPKRTWRPEYKSLHKSNVRMNPIKQLKYLTIKKLKENKMSETTTDALISHQIIKTCWQRQPRAFYAELQADQINFCQT